MPLAGSFRVEVTEADGTTHDVVLAGRPSVFDGPTDVVYAGRGSTLRVSLAGPDAGRVALCGAPATKAAEPKPFRHLTASDVPVELRGAGRASREVRNFGLPDVLDADSLLVCEVVTPAGNWSSWPPHKHDEERPGEETALEEIYYVETRSTDPRGTDPVGYLRVYGTPGAARRRPRRGAHRRRRPGAPRLARPRDRQPRRRPLLPQRHGRPRAASGPGGSATTRPTRGSARPGPTRTSTPDCPWEAPDDHRSDDRHRPAHRRPGGGALPGAAVERARRRAPPPRRRVPRHLRPRQRRRHRPGAARGGAARHRGRDAARPALRARAQRAGDGAHGRRLRQARATGCRPGRSRHPSAPARPTCSPAPRSRRSTASRCCSCPSGTFATRVSAPVLQELELPHAADVVGQRRLPPVVALLRPGRPPRAAARRAARRDAGARRPGRDRCRHDLAAAGRAGRGLRLAGRALRRARLARRPPAGRGRRGSRRSRMPCAPPAVPSSSPAAGSTTPAPRTRSRRSRRRPASPSPRPRPARARCCTATRSSSVPSGRPAPRPRTSWPARPTSSSASARAGPTSPRPREPPSATPSVRFVSLNVAGFDAGKHSGLSLVADAREALTALTGGARRVRGRPGYAAGSPRCGREWDEQVDHGVPPAGRGDRPPRATAAHPGRRSRGGQRADRPS